MIGIARHGDAGEGASPVFGREPQGLAFLQSGCALTPLARQCAETSQWITRNSAGAITAPRTSRDLKIAGLLSLLLESHSE